VADLACLFQSKVFLDADGFNLERLAHSDSIRLSRCRYTTSLMTSIRAVVAMTLVQQTLPIHLL
jgi:hypothetical protein